MTAAFCKPIPNIAGLQKRRPQTYHERRHHPICQQSRMTSTPNTQVPVPPNLQNTQIVGLGLASLDILASVNSFPQPDTKIRTTSVHLQGGGNIANTLTALRRLGLPTRLISQSGGDMYGQNIRTELENEGVDIKHLSVNPNVDTTFTYVIVDTSNATRTCISTPSAEDLHPNAITDEMIQDASILLLDGRHTSAAIALAKRARDLHIPILLDVERDRPHIHDLLPLADYIVTNSTYPFQFAPSAHSMNDALYTLLQAGHARMVIRTNGSKGCTLLQEQHEHTPGPDRDASQTDLPLEISRHTFVPADDEAPVRKRLDVFECAAWPVDRIVDTTGAGDAFIAGIAYGLVTNLAVERMLCLASFIAAKKLAHVGSRPGLPRCEQVPQYLLHAPAKTL